MMATIDPARLPYPWPKGVDPISASGPLRPLKSAPLPAAVSEAACVVRRRTRPPRIGRLDGARLRTPCHFSYGRRGPRCRSTSSRHVPPSP
jgi:hypothetical protein